jgi:hypothetical protein
MTTSTRKIILLGMNSPTGRVLEYDKPNSAGGRLFKLSGMNEMVYNITFERMNLIDNRNWDDELGRKAGEKLRKKFIAGKRTVVVLGDKVWKCLKLPNMAWIGKYEDDGATFYSIPHTSGRCLWYNSPKNKADVTRLLQNLKEDTLAGME